MLVFEGTFHFLVPLAASPFLIAGLLVRREFRWIGLFRALLFAHLGLMFIPYLGTLLPPPGRPVCLPANGRPACT